MRLYHIQIISQCTHEEINMCCTDATYSDAVEKCDAFLKKYDLNDGCTLISLEDNLAVNAILAEKFEDDYNINNYFSVMVEEL